MTARNVDPLADAEPLWQLGDPYPIGWTEVPAEWLAVKNPRKGRIEAIAESIRASGWFGNLLVQKHSAQQRGPRILIGNHRFRAGRLLDMDRFPVEVVDCDDAHGDRVLIADNRLSDVAGWDDAPLAVMLQDLQRLDMLDGTGFTPVDIEALLAVPPEEPDPGPSDKGPKIQVVTVKFPVETDEFEQWHAALIGEVGAGVEDWIAEVKRRLDWPS